MATAVQDTDALQLAVAKQRIVDRLGPWQADNIHLGHGIHTIREGIVGNELRAAHVVQLARDLLGGSLAGCRVLDLGAAEGIFAIEMARQGAHVVAVEGRAAHVERIDFARDAIGLDDLETVCADVRPLTVERFGEFDVVLCLGLLYHLDQPDVFDFAHGLRAVCRRAMILDTHYSLRPRIQVEHRERTYSGISYREHDPESDLRERERELRASLDNPASFWLTKPSLFNLLDAAGFTSVLEVRMPRRPRLRDRVTLVALAGEKAAALSAPQMPQYPVFRWRDGEPVEPTHVQRSPLWMLARRLLPPALRRALKRRLRR